MAKQICPACGCEISGEGYEKDGVVYCCQTCAEGGNCECGSLNSRPTNIPDSGGE